MEGANQPKNNNDYAMLLGIVLTIILLFPGKVQPTKKFETYHYKWFIQLVKVYSQKL